IRLLQPMSACPANQPVPRRFASRVGMPELSRASYRQCCACICSTRDKLNATIASRWCRCNRLNCSQVAQRVAVEGTFAGKLCPLAKDGQRHYLATGQRRGWTWGVFLIQAFGLAKIIDHHVQCCQKGITVNHQRAPFPCEWDKQAHCRIRGTFFSSPFYFTPNV